MNLFIVDHHILFRESLAKLIESHTGFHVVGHTNTIIEATEHLKIHSPVLILFHFDYKNPGEIDEISQLTARNGSVKVAILYEEEDMEWLLEIVHECVVGFISANEPASSVLRSLMAIQRGEVVIPQELSEYLFEELKRLRGFNSSNGMLSHDTLMTKFTPREIEVLAHLGVGASNHQIADDLSISINTVRVHVHNVLDKLQVKNRREAGQFAVKHGLTKDANPLRA